jgi:putative oxidoreductase
MTRFDLDRFASQRLAGLGPLILRISLAIVFLTHAHAKYFDYTLAGTAEFFAAHGFPRWTVYPVFATEVIGGVLLLTGWRTRYVAAALIPLMIGAIQPHLGNGWTFSNPNGGYELPVLVLLMLIVQISVGAGTFALGARSTRAASLQPSLVTSNVLS